MELVAGADLGANQIVVSLVEDHDVVERVAVSTPEEGPIAVVSAIVEGMSQLPGEPAALGVCAQGPVREGVVLTSPNLLGWEQPVPLARLLHEALEMPIAVENDATAFTIGEWVAGAARGAVHVLGVAFGTGIGGGLVLDARPYRGLNGAAGEFGHMCVRANGALCGCGRRGCVEAYAGRASMEMMVEVAVTAGRKTLLEDIRREHGKRRLSSDIWVEALRRGDALASEIIDDAIMAVGAAVGAVVNLLDVERVVIGGALAANLGPVIAQRITEAARPHLVIGAAEGQVVLAELGADAAPLGAAIVARELLAAKGLAATV
ncbi:MAG TPA: ROK family protein [Egibacteraceae bacterium]|nr:ROK family protein [Egibacteraceae bacterium]